MGYGDEQSLSPYFVKKLKGLPEGKVIANTKTKAKADYGLDTVLYTFKANKAIILNALKSKTFNSEQQKCNYICAIVANNMNDVYMRLLNTKKSQEKAKDVDVSILSNEGAEYKTNEDNTNKRLEDLW